MTTALIAFIAVLFILVLFLFAALKVAREYERGIVFRLGRLQCPSAGEESTDTPLAIESATSLETARYSPSPRSRNAVGPKTSAAASARLIAGMRLSAPPGKPKAGHVAVVLPPRTLNPRRSASEAS